MISTMLAPQTVLMCCNTVFAMVNFRGGVIRELISEGKRVVIAAPPDSYVDDLKAMGVQYIEWRLGGRSVNVLGEVLSVFQLFSIYRRVQPNAAFHYTIKPVIYGALVCRLLKIPFVSVITGLGYVFINKGLVSKLAKAFYKATLRWSKEIWLLNYDDSQTMLSEGLLTMKNVQMLPGEGIDTTFFSPRKMIATAKPQFILIARLLRDKGVLEYVEAARNLLQNGVQAEFTLLGTADADNPTAITSEMVREWESEGIVNYFGTSRDVRPFIGEAQCIVLPSYREGVPRSLLEAAAMARPVIATNVPGCRDVVIDGETGFLCEPRNSEALANAINQFIALSLDERRRMGESGRKLVCERFDEQSVIVKYKETLGRILGPS